MTEPLRHLSLCTGYGGLDIAVEALLPTDLVGIAEFDRHAATIAETRFPDVPNLGDIKTVDWTALDDIDLITAGYPCQPFSLAGKRKGADDERHLWPYIAEAVRALRPRLVVLENVYGHLSKGFAEVLGTLAEAGYDATWTCLRASDVGAPHRRERLFIVAADTRRERHGRGQDGRVVGELDRREEGAARQRERPREVAGDRSDLPDELLPAPTAVQGRNATSGRQDDAVFNTGTTLNDVAYVGNWGKYAGAVARWEALTRPAPPPSEPNGKGGRRLSPPFVEWMMGLPAGWVTDVDVPRTAQLKALGNGVVPQQAVAALDRLFVEGER